MLYVKHRMASDVRHLIKFAEKIQRQLEIETDPRVVKSLTQDLRVIKAAIGNCILDIPQEQSIAPVFEEKTKSKMAKSQFTLHDPGSPTSLKTQPRLKSKAHSMLVESPKPNRKKDPIAENFEQFLREKEEASFISTSTRKTRHRHPC